MNWRALIAPVQQSVGHINLRENGDRLHRVAVLPRLSWVHIDTHDGKWSMDRRDDNLRFSAPGTAIAVTALALLVGSAQCAFADAPDSGPESARDQTAALPSDPVLLAPAAWDPALAAALLPEVSGPRDLSASSAPAAELASGLGLQVQRKRRRFRQRAVRWVADKSAPIGWATDFLVGGADSGWHLMMDPTGDDEYVLEFKAKFR